MNHHEAVKWIGTLRLSGPDRAAVMPLSTEVVKGFCAMPNEITITFRTQYGNENMAHFRSVTLEPAADGSASWAVTDNTVFPLKSALTSREGSAAVKGHPGAHGLRVNDDSLTVSMPSVIPPLVTPAANLEREKRQAEVAHRAHLAMVAARKRRLAEERALKLARRRSLLRRSPGGRFVLRQDKAS